MRQVGLLVTAVLCALTLSACADESNALEANSAATPPKPLAPSPGTTIRMSWPGSVDTPGLRGDIVTLTAFEGDTIDLTVIVEGADGKRIPQQMLVIASTNGNVISNPLPVTGPDGLAQMSITAKKVGQDIIRVSGAGARKTLTLAVRSTADGNQDVAIPPSEVVATEPHNAPIVRDKPVALRDLPDVLPWKTLAEGVSLRLRDGVYQLMLADRVKALNGRKVKLQGFMLPLEQEEKQKHFLLTANPPTCFFCLPGGAESIVEVKCDQPVKFGFEPIVVSGTLEVIENHDFGLIYRLTQAATIKQ